MVELYLGQFCTAVSTEDEQAWADVCSEMRVARQHADYEEGVPDDTDHTEQNDDTGPDLEHQRRNGDLTQVLQAWPLPRRVSSGAAEMSGVHWPHSAYRL